MKTQEPSDILILIYSGLNEKNKKKKNYTVSPLNITELSNEGLLKMQFSLRLLFKFLF